MAGRWVLFTRDFRRGISPARSIWKGCTLKPVLLALAATEIVAKVEARKN
jgi:hypothetical protein